jgi:ABC-2 type transport system ATP-binding protein
MAATAPWRRTTATVLVTVALVAACSSSDDDAGSSGSAADGASPAATADTWHRPTCEVPEAASAEVAATPVPGVATDVDVTSFDGTVIRAHWFPVAGASAEAPAPTVLMGPGWGQPGDTNTQAVGVLGALNIASLGAAGYNVLTWDPRGFGASTGVAMVDSVDFEARDVQQLLTWLSTRPEAALDAQGDPTSGMIGGSYGGGIQLVTAAIDCRVDALVPVIAWHSLGTSLYKDDTFKQGWAGILSQVAGDSVDPHVVSANTAGTDTGVLPQDEVDWFLDRGPADLVGDIAVPTLFVGGTVDTLFTLDEDVTNHALLRDAGVPTAMFWFCGGHGVCLTDPGDPQPLQTAMISWLDRYVKGDESVDTGAAFTFVDQQGALHTADGYPPAAGDPVEASGSGTLELEPDGGAGPATIPAGNGELLAGLVAPITPAPAARAVSVAVHVDEEAMIVGAPELTIEYSGTAVDGVRPMRLFAQLVDDSTGVVVGNQITPVPVTLDGESHEATVPLEIVAHRAPAGSTLTLQLVATTPAYGQPRLGGSVELTDVHISLPVVTGTSPLG